MFLSVLPLGMNAQIFLNINAMVNVKILCVGKIKEKSFFLAIDEYIKRMRPFCNINITELSEYRLPSKPSQANIKDGLSNEALDFEKNIGSSDFVIALCIEGKELSSEELAKKIEEITLSGKSTVTFLIGSSFGLSESLKAKANFRLSFSKMTFPHQLMRLVLTEQLYRSFSIINHTEYHK